MDYEHIKSYTLKVRVADDGVLQDGDKMIQGTPLSRDFTCLVKVVGKWENLVVELCLSLGGEQHDLHCNFMRSMLQEDSGPYIPPVWILRADENRVEFIGWLCKPSSPCTISSSAHDRVLVCISDKNDPHAATNIRLVPPKPCMDEHTKTGTVIATAVTDDVDKGATHTYKVSSVQSVHCERKIRKERSRERDQEQRSKLHRSL